MAKRKPAGTISHQIFLPAELHNKIAAMAGYGKADDLIVECVTEAIAPRWKRWLAQETKKDQQSSALAARKA